MVIKAPARADVAGVVASPSLGARGRALRLWKGLKSLIYVETCDTIYHVVSASRGLPYSHQR